MHHQLILYIKIKIYANLFILYFNNYKKYQISYIKKALIYIYKY